MHVSYGPASIVRNGNRFVGFSIALVTGVVALLAHRESPSLADPHVCPGVLEWIGAATARYASHAPVAPWLLAVNRVLMVGAVAAFVGASFAASRRWPAAIAAGIAFGVQPLLSPSCAIFCLAAAGVAAMLACSRRPAFVVVLLTAGALINPPATVPVAALAAWWTLRTASTHHRSRAVAAGLLVVGAVWCLQFLVPPIPPSVESGTGVSCWVPVARAQFLPSLREATSESLAAPTMFALALAALGVFAGGRRAISMLFFGYVVAMFVTASVDPQNADRALLPAAVLLWSFVAAGLAELWTQSRRTVSRLAAVALTLLLPILQIPKLRASAEAVVRSQGHDAMTPADIHHLIDVLPDRSALVSEDAMVDLILRAEHRSWERMGKRVSLVARDDAAVARAVRESPTVLAFPRAQLALQFLGFRLTDRMIGDVSGLADVALVSPCAPIPRSWQALPSLNASTVVSLVADRERDRGPFVLYLATDAPPRPVPKEWSPGVSQGYIAGTFQVGRDAARLAEALKDDEFAAADFGAASYVARFELRRVPGAPRMLSIELGESPSVAYAKKWREAADERLRLCPAFPHTPASIGIR